MLGVALRRGADYEAAEAQYELILASEPENLDAVYNLGVLYSNYLQDPDQALASFQRARDLTNDDELIASLEGYIQEAERDIANRDRMERLKQLREEAARKKEAEAAAKAAEEAAAKAAEEAAAPPASEGGAPEGVEVAPGEGEGGEPVGEVPEAGVAAPAAETEGAPVGGE